MNGTKKQFMEIKKIKKYIAIVKIKNNPDRTAYCVKYRFDNLLKFTSFLDEKWEDWKWFNVYINSGVDKGIQIGNFTKSRRPITKQIQKPPYG
jgi:hypothetical protein